jgi:hypothetical protein
MPLERFHSATRRRLAGGDACSAAAGAGGRAGTEAAAAHEPFLAHTALLQLPSERIDTHLLASYLNVCNRVDDALSLLQEARGFGERSVETSKLLIDLLFARGDLAEPRAIAQVDAALLAPEDRLAIDAALT